MDSDFGIEEEAASSGGAAAEEKLPVCLIVLGMAGSGKTSFVQRTAAYLYEHKRIPYVVNLDPAVNELRFSANVDIRDAVDYKQVMKEYKLGPNGAIMTCLNLFSARFDQLMQLLHRQEKSKKYVIFDTPGQIEVFTWSASGTIITETLAASYPTVVVYVVDSARSANPVTFMSNMLYACSILYKARLPFIVVLNKADIISPDFLNDWMRDFESFHEALENEASYSSDLARSLSLVLDEFYKDLKTVSVSSLDGLGMDEFFTLVDAARQEYETDYRPAYERLLRDKKNAEVDKQADQLSKVKLDLEKDKGPFAALQTHRELLAASSGLRFHLGGVEMEDEEDEAELKANEEAEDEDEDERRELESFREFLRKQKEKDDS